MMRAFASAVGSPLAEGGGVGGDEEGAKLALLESSLGFSSLGLRAREFLGGSAGKSSVDDLGGSSGFTSGIGWGYLIIFS
jgi:hypothetical protein